MIRAKEVLPHIEGKMIPNDGHILFMENPEYVPRIYWLAVVLISVVGTLGSDNLTAKVPLKMKLL